jgi:hypothetical protein
LDNIDWTGCGNLHDLFVFASSSQNIAVKKNCRCFSSDVYHSHDRTVSLAGIWVHTQGFAVNSGKYYQPCTLFVRFGSQITARVMVSIDEADILEISGLLTPC